MSDLTTQVPLETVIYRHQMSPEQSQTTGTCWLRSTDVSSVKTPNYKELKRKKLPLPTNPYSKSVASRTGDLTARLVYSFGPPRWPDDPVGGYREFVPIPGLPGLADVDFDNLRMRALSRLSAERVNLPVSLLEARKSATMIGDTARVLAQAFLHAKRGNFYAAARLLGITNPKVRKRDTAASWWLGVQYGWLPLLSEVKNLAEATAQLMGEQKSRTATTRVMQKSSTTDEVTKVIMVSPRVLGTGIETIEVRAGITLTYEQDDAARLNQVLGLTNPLTVAWELLPLSFVVDWFLPVGDYFQNLDAASGLRFVSGSQYTIAKSQTTLTLRRDPNEPVGGYNNPDASGLTGGKQMKYVRTPLSAFPESVAPSFERGTLKQSAKHIASGIALLNLAFKGRT